MQMQLSHLLTIVMAMSLTLKAVAAEPVQDSAEYKECTANIKRINWMLVKECNAEEERCNPHGPGCYADIDCGSTKGQLKKKLLEQILSENLEFVDDTLAALAHFIPDKKSRLCVKSFLYYALRENDAGLKYVVSAEDQEDLDQECFNDELDEEDLDNVVFVIEHFLWDMDNKVHGLLQKYHKNIRKQCISVNNY